MYVWDGVEVKDPGEIDPENQPRVVGRVESLARVQEEIMKASGISSEEALKQMGRAYLESLHQCDVPLGAIDDILADIEFLTGGIPK